MFCPKCGTNMNDGELTCLNCSFVLNEEISKESYTEKEQEKFASNTENRKKINLGRIIYLIIAIVIIVMSFLAANKVYDGGMEIMQIQSVGGRTLEEAYYYELGNIYAGYSIFIRMMGIFFASILCKVAFDKK